MSRPLRFPRRNVAFSLTRLVVNQILPLAVLPLLLHRLHAEPFGQLMMAQAIGWYFVVVVEYGFNLTGVRALTLVKDDANRVSELLVEVGTTRLAIAACLAALLAASTALRLFNEDITLLVIVGFIAALGAAVQPIWFFQGLEKFPLISLVQMFSRAICLGSIVWLVHDPSHLLLAQCLMSAPFLVSALILSPAAHRFYRPGNTQSGRSVMQDLARHLRDGWDVFLSQVATTLFTSTNTLVLGNLLSATAAGHYTLADKIVRGVAMLTSPVTEAIYPRVAANIARDPAQTLAFARRVLAVGAGVLALAGVALVALAPGIARMMGGADGAADVARALGIMAFIPLAIFTNNICGTQILLGLGHKRAFRNIVLLAGAAVPLSSLLLVPQLGFVGAPVGAVIGEALIVGLMMFASIRAVGRNWLRSGHG